MTPETKAAIIMRELDWGGTCPIPIKEQVRAALLDMAAWQREQDAKPKQDPMSQYLNEGDGSYKP